MAKTTAKHWAESLDWTVSENIRSLNKGPVIFGHHFPSVEAIQSYRNFDSDSIFVRWRVRNDPEIHEFEIRPDYEYDEPYVQVQALLVAIKLSC